MTAPDQPLILRKVDHPHADDNAFRVIWNGLEVGSIGLQVGASGRTFWRWSIDDNGAPCREITTMGDTIGRDDAMKQFREAWDQFTADPERVRHMAEVKADTAKRMKRWGPGGR